MTRRRPRRSSALDAVAARAGVRRWLSPCVPLVRFLRSRRGRAWNSVRAEICADLVRRSPARREVDDLLERLVYRRVERVGGEIYGRSSTGQRTAEPLRSATGWALHACFYVDPADGALREAPMLEREAPEDEPVTRIRRTPELLYLRIDGIWYAVGVRPVPSGPAPVDRVLGRPADAATADARVALYGRSRLYAISKRQLASKALRQAGLENDR